MRVVVNEKMKVFHGHVPVALEADQEVSGELAAMLLERAPRKVTRLDEPEPEPATEPVHREPCVDGSVCGGEHCPPEDTPPSQPPPAGPPEPPTELDINATAAEVLAWVGEDVERAATALAAEQARDKPRSTLVKQLEKLQD